MNPNGNLSDRHSLPDFYDKVGLGDDFKWFIELFRRAYSREASGSFMLSDNDLSEIALLLTEKYMFSVRRCSYIEGGDDIILDEDIVAWLASADYKSLVNSHGIPEKDREVHKIAEKFVGQGELERLTGATYARNAAWKADLEKLEEEKEVELKVQIQALEQEINDLKAKSYPVGKESNVAIVVGQLHSLNLVPKITESTEGVEWASPLNFETNGDPKSNFNLTHGQYKEILEALDRGSKLYQEEKNIENLVQLCDKLLLKDPQNKTLDQAKQQFVKWGSVKEATRKNVISQFSRSLRTQVIDQSPWGELMPKDNELSRLKQELEDLEVNKQPPPTRTRDRAGSFLQFDHARSPSSPAVGITSSPGPSSTRLGSDPPTSASLFSARTITLNVESLLFYQLLYTFVFALLVSSDLRRAVRRHLGQVLIRIGSIILGEGSVRLPSGSGVTKNQNNRHKLASGTELPPMTRTGTTPEGPLVRTASGPPSTRPHQRTHTYGRLPGVSASREGSPAPSGGTQPHSKSPTSNLM